MVLEKDIDPDKQLSFENSPDFPRSLYFSIVDFLSNRGYEVKKVKDWLEVNPNSDYHQQLIQKRQSLEQNIGRILPNISDMRKQKELIKHDLRRLEEIEEHFKEDDEHVLKSDFVDLVDRQTEQLSLINMATSGKFPTIVVDFYKVDSEDDIEGLDVSETEKGILKKKLRLFNFWKDRYGNEIEEKVKMLRKEFNSRKASLENYKESLKPYLKAIHKIKSGGEDYSGINDPAFVEGYATSVAGVEIVGWRGITAEKTHRYLSDQPEKKYPYYCFIRVKFTRYRTQTKIEKENMKIEIQSELKNRDEIEEIKKEVDEREKKLWDEIEAFQGEKSLETEEENKEEDKKNYMKVVKEKVVDYGRLLTGKRKEGEFYLPEGAKDPLDDIVGDERDDLYDFIKDKIGAVN
ncbi:MAG: hypothetical protein ABEK17_02365 [Candidatus Aenigmatarchaeota archaeon]